MNDILQLSTQFRNAIEAALDEGEFDDDLAFHRFPCSCCGDTSDLLAQYLLDNDISTYYVCGNYRVGTFEERRTHGWLMTENRKTIIDITGDQFRGNAKFLNYNKPVYVGRIDEFHNLFEVEERDIHENHGISALGSICQPRLFMLYETILRYT